MTLPDDLAGMARSVLDANRYLTLGTAEPDGRPRVSPVFFTHAGYRTFYWVSSPRARHSANLAARPGVEFVVYDSTAAIGAGRAVYVGATAEQVPETQLAAACDEAFAGAVAAGAIRFRPEDLSGDAGLRLYRARATSCEVHVPGRDPVYGTGIDTRREVRL
ncbi:pyridoxamine 5'-phosphate oxidase family protein [Streptomyces sp. NBC_01808]|uniref:pyridoxamine 5'-phosphate oxidase family protein n=1 Tax=Streptomyces sp. NBC_01808 TaxID=2975947 RepID=UPI002DDA24EA|nr:pyridoxamine 5'-phosphate oxidase family protein [Streptomyces sp. NBC_01808]WSA37902.1 pyridoxamine 5'-phosphate oxidase family protein [Streptomyces sp. NBC_01808]